jgi:hypothetical protein
MLAVANHRGPSPPQVTRPGQARVRTTPVRARLRYRSSCPVNHAEVSVLARREPLAVGRVQRTDEVSRPVRGRTCPERRARLLSGLVEPQGGMMRKIGNLRRRGRRDGRSTRPGRGQRVRHRPTKPVMTDGGGGGRDHPPPGEIPHPIGADAAPRTPNMGAPPATGRLCIPHEKLLSI